jgi:glycerol kinase
MGQDLGMPIGIVRADGGAAANNLLMQMQADYTDTRVDRPRNLETTAFGAAMFAALGAGIYSSINQLEQARISDRIFEPKHSADRELHLAGWHRAIHATQVFAGTK